MKKFKLGKIQKAWIANLRKHPERRRKRYLGKGNSRNYQACCLGEALLTLCRINKKAFPFDSDTYLCDNTDSSILSYSYDKIGLYGKRGDINIENVSPSRITKEIRRLEGRSLASLNDNGYTWLQIADLLEKYPEAFFTESK